MPDYLHRSTKEFIKSIASDDLPEPVNNYIEYPDLSLVSGQPVKYWVITGDSVTLADQATRDAIDATGLSEKRDNIANEMDKLESYTRAFALVVLDEINLLRTNAGLQARTAAQLKTAVRNKLDG